MSDRGILRRGWDYVRQADVLSLGGLMAASAAVSAAIPFLVERYDPEWDVFRKDRAGTPLRVRDRFLQLDTDQAAWVLLMADFPGYYRIDNYRMGRPVYPAMVSLVARVSQSIPDPRNFVKVSGIPRAFLAAVVVNLAIFAASVLGFHAFALRLGLSREAAWFSAALLAFHPQYFWHLMCASTFVTSVGIMVASLWIFYAMARAPGGRSAAWLGGLAIGMLALAKEQYDVFLAGWILLLARRAWKPAVISFGAHLIPILVWLLILRALGLEFYSAVAERTSAETTGMTLFGELAYGLKRYPVQFLGAFGPVTLLVALGGGVRLGREGRLPWKTLLLFLALNLTLVLYGTRRVHAFYMMLLFVAVFPMAAVGLRAAFERWRPAGSPALWRCAAVVVLLLAAAGAWVSYWFSYQADRYRWVWPL